MEQTSSLVSAKDYLPVGGRILVIDDEEPVRMVMGDFLEDSGYEVLYAEDGQEGLEIFRTEHPDAVLTDIRMPVMDGLDVVAAMKEMAPATPVIIISGTGLLENVISALRLGAWDYILKPIQNLEFLHHTIQKALERAALLRFEKDHQKRLEEEVREKTAKLTAEIEARKKVQARLEFEAFHDPLTHIGNRQLCLKDLHEFRDPGGPGHLGLLLLDINNFKEINDSYGVSAGDRLLAAVAGRLGGMLTAGEEVYRLGGDEFAIMKKGKAVAALVDQLREISTAMNSFYRLGKEDVWVTFAAGLKLCPLVEIDPERMLNEVSFAHQQAKKGKGDPLVVYDASLHQSRLRRLSLEKGMPVGLSSGEFSLSYQPIMDLRKGCPYGFEALLRWDHPRQGAISPMEFIPIAEESGFISDLGEWALEKACSFWVDNGLAGQGATLSVNVSGKQFHHQGLVPRVRKILDSTAMNPEFLRLEITESALMVNVEETIRKLQEMKDLGIRISLDDFGTGYSSLEYLRHFPIDILKIDMSFIQKMDKDPKTFELVRVMANMASVFGLEMVAEGVESSAQKQMLEEIGGYLQQGFFYSRPLPQEKVPGFFATAAIPCQPPREQGG
jgi:diguanylate cyclase (GGDEF)-like protein